MRMIGLLGGMSWESSAEYYRLINSEVRTRLGGLRSADCLLRSLDFSTIEELQRTARWDEAGELLAHEATKLAGGGAELLVLCTNTMHVVADRIEKAVDVPLVHIADEAARELRAAGIHRVGLLATRYTMEQSFYRDRLRRHGIEVVTPAFEEREFVHTVIYTELCLGVISEPSRDALCRIIAALADQGAGGVLLGCTELGLLVPAADSHLPLFDTTKLHARRAVDLALSVPASP